MSSRCAAPPLSTEKCIDEGRKAVEDLVGEEDRDIPKELHHTYNGSCWNSESESEFLITPLISRRTRPKLSRHRFFSTFSTFIITSTSFFPTGALGKGEDSSNETTGDGFHFRVYMFDDFVDDVRQIWFIGELPNFVEQANASHEFVKLKKNRSTTRSSRLQRFESDAA
jgi:hypothetical protein